MAVPSVITDLNVVAASNSPAGADSVASNTGPDEYFRALSAIIKREQSQGTATASAATVDLGAITTGSYLHITGSTGPITSFGTVAAGVERTLVFDSTPTITHNATSMILLDGISRTMAAGDISVFRSEGSGNWREVSYHPAIGFLQSGTGAVARTAQAKLSDVVSVFDFMTTAQIADVLAGTALVDVSVALQAAFDTRKSLYFPQGVYLAGNLNVTQASVIPGQANSMRHLDFNGSTLKLKALATHGIKVADSDFIRITDLKIDMNNVANAKGLWHSGGWNLHLDSFYTAYGNTATTSYDLFIDGGSNPVIYQPGPALWGAYLSEYHNVYCTRMKINGPYITTLSFFNLNVSCPKIAGAPGYSIAINDAGSLSFYSPVIQNSGSAFYFTGTCNHVKVYSLYSEGCDYIYNGTATLTNLVSVGGQTSVLVAYKNIAIGTAYDIDDHPNGSLRLQYVGDTLRSNNGYVEEQNIMTKTAGLVSSERYTVEPGGWTHTTGLVSHEVKVESATPLVARYGILMNRGDVAVEAIAYKWDTTNAVPWMMLGSNAGDPTAAIDTAGYNIRIRTASTPASSAAAGNAGEMRWDTSYLYVCTALNTWKRIALVAF